MRRVELLTILILFVVASLQAQVFTVGDRFSTSTRPIVVTADFDGDLDIDLAIAHRDEYEIWIYSNDGAASFSHSYTITECEVNCLCVADLNGDGYNDLMWFDEHTVFYPPWGLTMYFNNGDGTFYQGFKEEMGSAVMCAGYFNADAITDVAVYVGALDDLHVALLFGTGDGSFAPPVKILPGIVVRGLATTDLDHDGDNDIIVGTDTWTQTLLNNGDGTFADTLRTGGLGSAPVADIDGDSYLDMVGMIPGGACDFVPGYALSEHDGTFSQARTAWLASGVLNGAAVGAGDYNGDGFADIAWYPRDLSRVTIGLNNGRSAFREFEYITEVAAGGAAIRSVDLDGDSDIDLVITGVDDTLTIALSQAAQHIRRILVPGDFPTVQEAVDYAWNLDTIIVDPGIYYENIDFGGKNIVLMSSDFAEPGRAAGDPTILDGGGIDRVFTFDNEEDERSVIAGFIIQHGNAAGQGGGVFCDDTASPVVMNNVFRENYASNGGGAIAVQNGTGAIKNNLIVNNSSGWWGGAIFIGGYLGDFVNNTVYGNTTVNNGGGLYFNRGAPTIRNNIFWGNSSASNGQQIGYLDTAPTITYCVVQGGWPGEGNIDSDPLFVDPDGGDFSLGEGSPCINAGDPDGPLDPDGTVADIGSVVTQQVVDVEDADLSSLPDAYVIDQNHPNPFNPVTEIEFSIPTRSLVTVEIFNILGQKIITLVDETRPAGSYRVTWNGVDDNHRAVATGVYLYRLRAGDFVQTKKMMLLK